MNKMDRIEKFKEFMPVGLHYLVPMLDKSGFFTAPASTKYHGAYPGGLFDHSYEMTKNLVEMTERLGLTWEREASPYIVGMFHDLCKCDNYKWDEEKGVFIYNPEMIIPGHGDKSIAMLSRYLHLTMEEIVCIRWHMGAFETDTKMWGYYGQAIEEYPNVLYTHTADMFASRIIGI